MKRNFTTIEKILKEAGRLEGVKKILEGIMVDDKDHNNKYVVEMYVDKKGEFSYLVDSRRVKNEAEKLLNSLPKDDINKNIIFRNLYRYVNFNVLRKLSGYSIDVARKRETDDIEIIRDWLVLQDLIIYFNEDFAGDIEWQIDDCWKVDNRIEVPDLTPEEWLEEELAYDPE